MSQPIADIEWHNELLYPEYLLTNLSWRWLITRLDLNQAYTFTQFVAVYSVIQNLQTWRLVSLFAWPNCMPNIVTLWYKKESRAGYYAPYSYRQSEAHYATWCRDSLVTSLVGWSRSWIVAKRRVVRLQLLLNTTTKSYPRNALVHFFTSRAWLLTRDPGIPAPLSEPPASNLASSHCQPEVVKF